MYKLQGVYLLPEVPYLELLHCQNAVVVAVKVVKERMHGVFAHWWLFWARALLRADCWGLAPFSHATMLLWPAGDLRSERGGSNSARIQAGEPAARAELYTVCSVLLM